MPPTEVAEIKPIRNGGVSPASFIASSAAIIPNKAVRDTVRCGGKEISFFSSSLLRFTSDTGTSRAVGKRVDESVEIIENYQSGYVVVKGIEQTDE